MNASEVKEPVKTCHCDKEIPVNAVCPDPETKRPLCVSEKMWAFIQSNYK